MATPVLNNTNKPIKDPTRGINISRQRKKLFLKIVATSGVISFTLSLIAFASAGLS
jgi:hypothetical protein